MKIVKLNRRFKQYKEYGHTIALKFSNGYSKDAGKIEKICRDRFDSAGWMPDSDWYHYYGARSGRYDVRPYWISFRNEADLTLVLLSADLTQNS